MKLYNKKLVEEITDTDLGVLTETADVGQLPSGSKRSRKNQLKTNYRTNLVNAQESLNRAILGRKTL